MKKLFQIFPFYLLCAFSTSVWGQNCCSGGVPISGNLGLPAGDPGSLQISVSYDLNLLRRLKTGTREDEETSIRRLRTTQSALLMAGYTLSPRFSIESFVSWVRQERTVTNRNTNSTNFEATSGIGDLVLMGKYFVLPADRGPVSWQLGLGLKMPTGSFLERADSGIPLGMDLQPGSGTWDGILWSRFSHIPAIRPSMSLSATASYSLRGTNPEFRRVSGGNIQDWQIGDEFQLLVGVADRIQINALVIDPSISFRLRLAERDVTNGFELDNTGGEWLFWVPGFSLALHPNISWQATMDVPVYSRIKGTQLTPSFRLNTGIIVQFPTRSSQDPLNILGK